MINFVNLRCALHKRMKFSRSINEIVKETKDLSVMEQKKLHFLAKMLMLIILLVLKFLI